MAKGSLTVVGTGFSLAGQVTREALSAIERADRLFYLVNDNVTSGWLEGKNPAAESLHSSYRSGRDRGETYLEMAERILAPVRDGRWVCAAFYGHPGVFATPPHEAVRRARAEGYEARMLPGISAEDCLFADLGLDPGALGCQSFEATDFLIRRRRFDPASLLVLWQVGVIGVRDFRKGELWNRRGLEVLSEDLLRHYPATHQVTLYEASPYPVCRPRILRLAVAELGGAPATVRTTLCVPPRELTPVDAEMLARLGGEPILEENQRR